MSGFADDAAFATTFDQVDMLEDLWSDPWDTGMEHDSGMGPRYADDDDALSRGGGVKGSGRRR